jgi:hypothetical protein
MPRRNTDETLEALASTLTGLPTTFERAALERMEHALLLPLGACLDREQFPAAATGQERLYPSAESPNGPARYRRSTCACTPIGLDGRRAGTRTLPNRRRQS